MINKPVNDKRRYQCERSGEMFAKLYKQWEWAGDIKTWTGLWVGDIYMDQLQGQLRTPKTKDDPKSLVNARPFTPGQHVPFTPRENKGT